MKRLHYDSTICSPQQYCKLLEDIFYSSQTRDVIDKDVYGLPGLLKHVAKSGDWPPAWPS
jgi:hypothetical protein